MTHISHEPLTKIMHEFFMVLMHYTSSGYIYNKLKCYEINYFFRKKLIWLNKGVGKYMYIKNFSFIETKFMPYDIIDLPELKEKTHVFQDRVPSGKVLKEQPFWLMTDL
jgi:hypothetical protein